jgi:hypothetical protein
MSDTTLSQLERNADAAVNVARPAGESKYAMYMRTRVARAMLAEIRRAKQRREDANGKHE